MSEQQINPFLDQLVDNVIDSMIPSQKVDYLNQNNLKNEKENFDGQQNQQLGRQRIEILTQDKQNVLIRKMLLIYLNSYLRNAKRWHVFSQVFYKRQKKGCIFVQFKDIENIAINGDKMVIGLSFEDSKQVNNIYLLKALEMYDPATQFVVCFNVNSYVEKKGWFLTCILDITTNKACYIDIGDEPVIFNPSVAGKIEQCTQLQKMFSEQLNQCLEENKQLQTEIYCKLEGFSKFLLEAGANDILNNEDDEDIEDKIEKSIETEEEHFNIVKVSPFFIKDFVKDDKKEEEIKVKMDQYILNNDKIDSLKKKIKEQSDKLEELKDLLDDDQVKQKEIEQKNQELLSTISKESLKFYTCKQLQEHSFNYKIDIVENNRHLLIVLRNNLKEQRNLYNCCNDPCNKTENALRQFEKYICSKCKFLIYCSEQCLKQDKKRHFSECKDILLFKQKNKVDVWEKKLEETAEIEYSLG